jgi:hypothetical protein
MRAFNEARKMLLDLEIDVNGRRQKIVNSRKSTAAVGFLLNMASAEVLYNQLRKGRLMFRLMFDVLLILFFQWQQFLFPFRIWWEDPLSPYLLPLAGPC